MPVSPFVCERCKPHPFILSNKHAPSFFAQS
uniref:Uncharacterized protein n=1 Tax=Anguilla anguilla TaxID=7936 RepID=A0A0E9T828_ANGAN